MFAALKSLLHYCWRIVSFPQQRIRWNALQTGFHWDSAFVRWIPNPSLNNYDCQISNWFSRESEFLYIRYISTRFLGSLQNFKQISGKRSPCHLRVDLNPRISKICASWMSVWNMSANYVLVPLKFNPNWNIWKPFFKTSPLDFSGQRLENTSLVVFFRFHSFSQVVKWPEFIKIYTTNICCNVKLVHLTEVCSVFVGSWVHSRPGLLYHSIVVHACVHLVKQNQ